MMDKIRSVFNKSNLGKFFNKSSAYKKCLTDGHGNLTVDGQRVIKDLMQFCNAYKSTIYISKDGVVDPLRLAYEEGRRTVFNRIRDYLNLSEADLLKAKQLEDE
jgi:hypothetical protein